MSFCLFIFLHLIGTPFSRKDDLVGINQFLFNRDGFAYLRFWNMPSLFYWEIFLKALPNYQLDFTTPGNSPLCARWRSWLRQSPKSLYTPLGLPVAQQRFLMRFGALFLGSAWILRCISSLSIGSFAEWKAFSSFIRLLANLSTSFLRFTSRAIIDFLAMRRSAVVKIQNEF